MKQPEAILSFEVYKNARNLMGIAKVTLPDINFLTQMVSGAGIGGNIEAVLTGIVDAMTANFNFNDLTAEGAVEMIRPEAQVLDLRVAKQQWDTVKVNREVVADKYILLAMPKSAKPGTIAPASTTDASGDFVVYRYEAYKDGKELWCIDPRNYICRIFGKDYLSDVRKALGK